MPPRPLLKSLAGPQGDWPDEGKLSLDVGRAISAGQELSPLLARLAYSPAKLSLEQLKIGQLENVTLDGAGNFDRVNATGWFALNSSAASLEPNDQPDRPPFTGTGRADQCDGDEARPRRG